MLWTREILLRDLVSSSIDFVFCSLERFQKRSHHFLSDHYRVTLTDQANAIKVKRMSNRALINSMNSRSNNFVCLFHQGVCVCVCVSRSLCWSTNGSDILKCDERMCASHSIVTCSANDVKHVYACNACAKSIWTIRDCLMGCDKKPTNKPNNITLLFFVRKSRYCRQVSLWQSDNFLLAKHDARGMSLVVTSSFDVNQTR